MTVLVLMHVENEGPGTLGEYLLARNIPFRLCRLFEAQPIPGDPREFDAVVSMGGPMHVYEEDKYPFLKEETLFLRQAIESGTPVLGVCLGAQMIARACGAAVKKAPVGEFGWARVRLTPAARTEPVFQGISETLQVFQWHEDTFDVPADGRSLATSEACANQAFRCRNAYGLQFHLEVTPEMLKDWFKDPEQQKRLVDSYEDHREELTKNALTLYANFVVQIGEKRAGRI